MKNTFRILGIIALTALIGFTILSCKDAANDVDKVNVTAASRAFWAALRYTIGPNPYVQQTAEYQILEWKALGKNVTKYEVYLRKDLKNSATALFLGGAQYGYGYDSAGRSFAPNNDYDFTPAVSTPGVNYNPRTFKDDTWFARIPVNMGGIEPGKYYFGVRAFVTDDKFSNIVWTENTIEIKANIFDIYYPRWGYLDYDAWVDQVGPTP